MQYQFPAKLADLKIAVIYDRVNSRGGAEQILKQIKKLLPQAELVTSVYDPVGAPWAKSWSVNAVVNNSFLASKHRWLGWLMPWIFESVELEKYDLVISVTSEAAKGVITKPEQLHLCYLLTPTRYLWSHRNFYLQQIPNFIRWLAMRIFKYLQTWDYLLAQRPDKIIAISNLVARRCLKYYGRQSDKVIYPPLVSLPASQEPRYKPTPPFFFTWGRLVAYKRFDLLIKAACQGKFNLVIAGDGPLAGRLRQLANQLDPQGRLIKFVGWIDQSSLAWYLQNAQAAVFPQVEDFGLVVLEAMSQGCPVIVNKSSGAAEIVRPNIDGLFLEDQKTATISQTMSLASQARWHKLDIKRQASQYAEVAWQKQFIKFVESEWQKHRKGMR